MWVGISGTTRADVETRPVAATKLPPLLGQKGVGEGESRSFRMNNNF